jgi:hypothetical protein
LTKILRERRLPWQSMQAVQNKKDASPYEFDLVINCDYIKEPRSVAEIILSALREKFGLPETGP